MLSASDRCSVCVGHGIFCKQITATSTWLPSMSTLLRTMQRHACVMCNMSKSCSAHGGGPPRTAHVVTVVLMVVGHRALPVLCVFCSWWRATALCSFSLFCSWWWLLGCGSGLLFVAPCCSGLLWIALGCSKLLWIVTVAYVCITQANVASLKVVCHVQPFGLS